MAAFTNHVEDLRALHNHLAYSHTWCCWRGQPTDSAKVWRKLMSPMRRIGADA